MNSPAKSAETRSIDALRDLGGLGDLMASLELETGGLPDGVEVKAGLSGDGEEQLVFEGADPDVLGQLYAKIVQFLEKLESASDSGDPCKLDSGLAMFRGRVAKGIGLALSAAGLGMMASACTGPDDLGPKSHGDSFGNARTPGTVMSPLTKPELYSLGEGVAPEWGVGVFSADVLELPDGKSVSLLLKGGSIYYIFSNSAKDLQSKDGSKFVKFESPIPEAEGYISGCNIYKNKDGVYKMRFHPWGKGGFVDSLVNVNIDSEGGTIVSAGGLIPVSEAPYPENLRTYGDRSTSTAPDGSSHMISMFEEYGPVENLSIWTGDKKVLKYYNPGGEYDHGDEHILNCGAPTISGDVAITAEISGPFSCALKYRPNWTNVAPVDQPASLIAINGQSDKNLYPRIIPGINGQGGLIYTQQYENEEGELKYRLVVVAVEMPDELNCGDGLCDLGGGEDFNNCSSDCEKPVEVAEPTPDVVEPLSDAGTSDVGTPDVGTPDVGTPDVGTPDAGNPDAGNPDAGNLDAGNPDVGTPDVGTPDAGNPDAGNPDAGNPDAGNPDAGNPDAKVPDTAEASIQQPPAGDGGCNSSNGPSKAPWYMVLPMLLVAIRRKLRKAVAEEAK